jgi:hypothetical protein
MSEWGNPAGVMPSHLLAESIGLEEPTRGSEPSQYPEEEKATAIPSVAASESGTAQTSCVPSWQALRTGGRGARCDPTAIGSRSYKAPA